MQGAQRERRATCQLVPPALHTLQTVRCRRPQDRPCFHGDGGSPSVGPDPLYEAQCRFPAVGRTLGPPP
jgi:hypothetical protein